jgi:CHASE3 domain sensor protein
MDQKLSVGFFLLGCVIVVAVVLSFNRIEKLQDIIIKQQQTIELQDQAIQMQKLENTLLRACR